MQALKDDRCVCEDIINVPQEAHYRLTCHAQVSLAVRRRHQAYSHLAGLDRAQVRHPTTLSVCHCPDWHALHHTASQLSPSWSGPEAQDPSGAGNAVNQPNIAHWKVAGFPATHQLPNERLGTQSGASLHLDDGGRLLALALGRRHLSLGLQDQLIIVHDATCTHRLADGELHPLPHEEPRGGLAVND